MSDPLNILQAVETDEPLIYYNKAEFIQTASGNKVSRQSVLCGSQNISLAGKSTVKPGVILRGDLQLLKIGKYVTLNEQCVLRPPYKKYKGSFAFFPLTIGDFVTVGARTVISAANIGSCVDIGEDCVISKRCIVKDNAMILSGTVLPPDTVVPPLTCFGGSPGKYLGDLPESQAVMQKQNAMVVYRRFLATPKKDAGEKKEQQEEAKRELAANQAALTGLAAKRDDRRGEKKGAESAQSDASAEEKPTLKKKVTCGWEDDKAGLSEKKSEKKAVGFGGVETQEVDAATPAAKEKKSVGFGGEESQEVPASPAPE